MDLQEYLQEAAITDSIEDDTEAIRLALLGIAGEASEIVSEAKKWSRDKGPMRGLESRVSEELGDLLWYIASLARRLNLNLNTVAADNLVKTKSLWSSNLPPISTYDDHKHEEQKLPRQFTIKFQEDLSGDVPKVSMIAQGPLRERVDAERERKGRNTCVPGQLGDPLDDNAASDDSYRYHDVIHLGHAVILGWSPVLRSLIGAKRKSVGDFDRVQDGARAIAIEEGLAAFAYNYMEENDFAPDAFDWELFKHARRTVRGLEVESQPFVAWKEAYTQAFTVLPNLRDNRGGVVECDLDTRELQLVE
ncbi:MAG: hypothetical protein OXN44_00290 [Acidimicrobiaceae bacterium]|nr:hypothetical protein [Acidimicrobiaceae bacterium]